MTLTESRLTVLKDILNQFGIERNGDELTLTSDTADFADAKNRFLQATIKVGDMSMLAQAHVQTYFADDIRMFFNANNIRYVEGAQFRGKSGLLCPYDFVLPFTNKQSERFCTSITRPSQRLISSTLFSWEDTQSARKTPSELVVFLNDSDRRIDNQLITALEKYNAYPIKWSEREFKENLYKLASRVVLVALVGSEVSAVCCVDLPSVAYGDSSPRGGELRKRLTSIGLQPLPIRPNRAERIHRDRDPNHHERRIALRAPVQRQHAPADIGHEHHGYPHSRLLDSTNRSHVSPP